MEAQQKKVLSDVVVMCLNKMRAKYSAHQLIARFISRGTKKI